MFSTLLDQIVLAPANALWIAQGLPPDSMAHLHLSKSPDPSVDSHFKLGFAAQTAIGVSALAAAHFHKLRTGEDQDVSVEARHAVIEFNSEKYYTADDQIPTGVMFDELSDFFKTKDGYVRLHANFPHHKQGLIDILKCAPTKAAVAAALASWSSIDFEAEVFKRNLCAVAVRSFEEADRHPHARQTINNESVYIRKIGDAPKRIISGTEFASALDGIRVLDLTRVLAGPVCGRTLAAHGADTLLVTSPNLPSLPVLDMDTSRGKRTTQLDLRDPKDKATLQSLVKDADVFLQAYRPGGLQGLGFGPEEVAKARPGIVYGTLSAYGFSGALKDAKGFDSLLQALGGMNVAEAQAYKDYVLANGGNVNDFPPHRPLPMQALDHAAGYLLAFGIISALCRTITEGGSYEVHVSLGATLHWVRSLGYLSPEEAFKNGEPLPPRGVPLDTEVAGFSTKIEQAVPDAGVQPGPVYQNITAIRHAAVMSKTKVRVGEAPMRLDAHQPVWLKRP